MTPPNQIPNETHAIQGGQVARGATLMVAFKLLDRSIGLVSTLILARILTPADFGLVAMATAVVAFTQLMGAFGFETALIQRQDAQRHHYDTAWTFNALFGLAIGITLCFLANPMAAFYREPRLAMMLPVLALGALVGGFENVGTVAFRKNLDFGKEFRYLLTKRISAFVVTVSSALIFRTYWALIAGMVTGTVASVLISYLLHPYRPRFSLMAKADLMHFSKWLFISNLIQFLHSRSTDFILGRTIGSHGLGVYNIGVEIAAMPSTELIAPLNRAVYPVYSRLANAREMLWEQFAEVFGMIGLLAVPVSFGLVCVADAAVRVLLGEQWLESIPIIRIAAVSGLASALQGNLYLVILALGQPKANTLLSGTLLVISLPIVVVASLHYGAFGAACAHFGASLLGLVGISFVFSRITGISLIQLAALLWRPFVAASFMAASVQFLDTLLTDIPSFFRLFVLISVGALCYIFVVIVFWLVSGRPDGAEKSILDKTSSKLLVWKQALFRLI